MKKVYIYILLPIIVMFLCLDNVSAESNYVFEVDRFASKDKAKEFINFLCSEGSNVTCEYLPTDGGEKDWVTGYSYQHDLDSISQFKITQGTDAKSFKESLTNVSKCMGGSSNCSKWVISNYCGSSWDTVDSSSNFYKTCNAIGEARKEENNGGACSFDFIVEDGDDGSGDDIEVSYKIEIPKKNSDKLEISVYSSSNDTTAGFDNILVTGAGTLYLYEKGENFSDFISEYKSKYDELGSCPTGLHYCEGKGSVDGSRSWYATFNLEECSNFDKYTGRSQSLDEDGNVTDDGIQMLPVKDYVQDLLGPALTIATCDDIFMGEDGTESGLKDVLIWIRKVVQIGIPIAMIGLGSLDFAKAVFSGSEDGMKKAQKKFIMRLIIGVGIFLIPSVLKLILTIANGVWENISPDFCGIL